MLSEPSHRRAKSHPTLSFIRPRRQVLTPMSSSMGARLTRLSDPESPSFSSPETRTRRHPLTAVFRAGPPGTPITIYAPRLVPFSSTPRTAALGNSMAPGDMRGGVGRMVLINPAIAAQLRRGGVVNVRSRDGEKRWRISLPPSAGTPIIRSA